MIDTEKQDTHHEHCWHTIFDKVALTVLLTSPPPYKQVCCHCGEKRTVTPPAPWDGHGPFYPKEQV